MRARRPGCPWGTRIGMTRFGGSGRSDMGTGRSCCAHAPMFKLLSSVLSGSTAGAGRRNTTAFWRVAHPVQHPADAGEQRVVRHWQGRRRRRHRVLPGVVSEVVALQHRAQLHTAKYARAGPALRALRARSLLDLYSFSSPRLAENQARSCVKVILLHRCVKHSDCSC
ncbi:hypothetical protein VPH35_095628 [Triticum aestivum]